LTTDDTDLTDEDRRAFNRRIREIRGRDSDRGQAIARLGLRIAWRCRCSIGPVAGRLKLIRAKTGIDPKDLRDRLARLMRTGYFQGMSTQEILLEEIKHQPEPVLREVWHYLKFLTRQREEEQWADVLPAREVEQEVLDIIDSK
jgi:hypothetical protein